MKPPVKVKPYLSTSPIHSLPYSRQDKSKIRLSFSQRNQSSLPISQSDDCLKTYFNSLPDAKRKHNLSVFNFFIKKSPKKTKDTHFPKDKTQLKNNFDQSPQGSFKVFEPYPSLSTEKLKIIHMDSKKNPQIKTQNMKKSQSNKSDIQMIKEENANKINQALIKQTKFDRKKYMYYRYRKKPIQQQQSEPSFNQDSDTVSPEQNKIKRLHSFVNSKIEEYQKRQHQENEPIQRPIQFKRSFYRIIPQKNQSFSQIKCKLTIEPIKRDLSQTIIEREVLAKTTRERQRMKVIQTSGTKIFSQAIHFKSRRCRTPQKQTPETNPELGEQAHQKILGWNFAEQQHEEQYF